MSQPTMKLHRRKPVDKTHEPQAGKPCTLEEGMRRLGADMLCGAVATVEEATKTYGNFCAARKTFHAALKNLSATVHWVRSGQDGNAALLFDKICEELHREPSAMRKNIIRRIPRSLQIALERAASDKCLACGHQKELTETKGR